MTKRDPNMEDSNEDLLIIPVPALVAVLLKKETEKGTPLTEDEVIEIRDNAASIAMPKHAFKEVEKSRGYQDIDPEDVWDQWQIARIELHDNDN